MRGFITISRAACAALMLVALPAMAADRTISIELNKGEMVKLDRPAASIVIADPLTADVQVVSPKLVFVHGKKIGQTSLYAIDAQDNPILNVVIDVTHDITGIERAVKRVVPDAEVGFRTVQGGLVMDGYASSVAESESIRSIAEAFIGPGEKMVNMIQTAGSDQVMLKVKIVEMSRNDLKKFGINLQSVLSNGGLAMQVIQGNDIAAEAVTSPLGALSLLDRSGSADTHIFSGFQSGNLTLGGVIDALETQGLASTLAEPSLTTTSGKAASFLAGGQFPLPVKDQNDAITIQYKPFGVSLNFTPVVMSKDRISITVAPEVSTLNFDNPIQVSGITYPILLTRQASAVVELGSGDSFALAGLLQNSSSNNINKFPGLGDVPVLGTLFRSHQFQNNESELVILVTPYIVRPVSQANRMQTPLDGYKAPNDLQRLLVGNLYEQEKMSEADKVLPPKPEDSMPKLHGEGGFILE
jgi:pilus assembly protein CpaC